MKALFFALTVLLASVTWAPAQTPQAFCESSSFSLSPAEVQLSVSDFGMSADKDHTNAHLVLRNESTEPITRVLILAESLDDKSRHIFTLPFYAATNEEFERNGSFAKVIGASPMENPLLPQAELPLGITLPSSTARCPVTVRPVLIDVSYWNGTSFHYALPDWQLEPSLGSATTLQLSSFPGLLPSQEVVDIKVDSKRRISNVNVHNADPQVAEWFRTQLSQWSVFPEMKDGHPVPTEVRLLFRFHKVFDRHDATRFDEGVFQSGTVMPIDVFPKGNTSQDNQAIFVGGLLLVAPQ